MNYGLYNNVLYLKKARKNFKKSLLRLKKNTRSGVRTHAGIPPLELKSNALTTRPSWS